MASDDNYFAYLQQRSYLGLIYRNYILYPRLKREVKGRTLDIGCGIGDFLKYRPNTVGVDINPKLVDLCRSQGLDAREMAQNELPFEDHNFDSVVLDNVLEHIESPNTLLGEIQRVLKPKGAVLVGVPGSKGYASDPDHKVYYSKDTLRATMATAGFSEVKVFYAPLQSDWLNKNMRQYCIYGLYST